MDPLETLLAPLTRILNRNISEMTPARELCARLSGKVVAIRVSKTALAMYVSIDDQAVRLSSDSEAEPDAVIAGSLLSLARIAMSGEEALDDVTLEFTGDASTAQAFRKLLGFAKPDVEEELAGIVGDGAAHSIGEFTRALARWADDARRTMGDNLREYLQEESRDVPSRYEAERFARDVNTLRDDVERLAARIDRLERED